MVTEALDFKFLLIENYKKLNIKEEQLATIFVIDHLINQGNKFITSDLLSLKMSMDSKKIDAIMADLLTRGFIEFTVRKGKTVTTLNPLKKKLYHEFELSLANEQIEEENENNEEALKIAQKECEVMFERTLSPVEISKIKEWIGFGYNAKTIVEAVKECVSKGKKNLRYADKILLEWAARDDIEKEGHSPISDSWAKNLEETIKIAKTPWLDDDK